MSGSGRRTSLHSICMCFFSEFFTSKPALLREGALRFSQFRKTWIGLFPHLQKTLVLFPGRSVVSGSIKQRRQREHEARLQHGRPLLSEVFRRQQFSVAVDCASHVTPRYRDTSGAVAKGKVAKEVTRQHRQPDGCAKFWLRCKECGIGRKEIARGKGDLTLEPL